MRKPIAETASGRDAPQSRRRPRTPDPLDRSLGERVRRRRIRIGWSTRELGDAIGVSLQQVCRYEAGSDRMAAAVLIRICAAVRISVGELCSGIGDVPDPDDRRDGDLVSGTIEQLVDDFVAIRDAKVRSQLSKLITSLATASRREPSG